jgi:3-phosphoshikimate 1-carboxyvinyltransferase
MKFARLVPPSSPLSAEVSIPGSKSFTNRSLVTAALAHGTSLLYGPSKSADSEVVIRALQPLGIEISGEDPLSVSGGSFQPWRGTIDVGPAGTSMRFLTALCAALPGAEVVLQGSERMHRRPIAPLVSALRALGADITYLGDEGCPPLRITGRSLEGTRASLEGSVSSQFFTALLLVAPLLRHGLTLEVEGTQISRSYIDMTLSSMERFGVVVHNDEYRRYIVAPEARYTAQQYHIEGDGTGATYFWGLAAISGGRVRTYHVPATSSQGDATFPALLEQMGCFVTSGTDSRGAWIEIAAPDTLHGISCDMELMPDAAQTLAVVAAVARGVTTITGLSTLRVKETDRIAAVRTELTKLGIRVESTDDSLTIWGATPTAARISTYEDHRMAMAFAMLGARFSGIEIEAPDVVGKSFPNFWEALGTCGVSVEFGSSEP